MTIQVTQLPDAEPDRDRHVAIGTFDGVHLGHQAVIDDADTVLTFEPHPLTVIHPEAAPKLIMPFKVKRDVIDGLGVEELVVIPFDREFSKRSAEDFIEQVLIEKLERQEGLGRRELPVRGEGQGGRGDAGGATAGSRPGSCPLVEVDGETVSSTRVRGLVAAGDVEQAMHCLGAPFMLEGEVVSGDRRGRELGFPTANVVPDDSLVVPGHGVYAAFANGHPAAVNVGVRPTFETGTGPADRVLPDRLRRPTSTGRTCGSRSSKRLRGEKRFTAARS